MGKVKLIEWERITRKPFKTNRGYLFDLRPWYEVDGYRPHLGAFGIGELIEAAKIKTPAIVMFPVAVHRACLSMTHHVSDGKLYHCVTPRQAHLYCLYKRSFTPDRSLTEDIPFDIIAYPAKDRVKITPGEGDLQVF